MSEDEPEFDPERDDYSGPLLIRRVTESDGPGFHVTTRSLKLSFGELFRD